MYLKNWSQRFLRWFCNPDYLEDIEGDLEEIYEVRSSIHGGQIAGLQYAVQVLVLCRPTLMKKFNYSLLLFVDMLRNHFRIGVRNIVKHWSSSIIHVIGLALGLAAFLLIHQYTVFEKSYDRFHPDAGRLVRLTTDNIVNGNIMARDAMSFAPSGAALKETLPDIEEYTTTFKFPTLIFRKGDQIIQEPNVLAVDSNFLNLFGYSVLAGDRKDLLSEPNTLVLTRSQAQKYFGSTEVVGKSLELLGRFQRSFEVVGLVEDTPENTHYKFDILMSLASIKDQIEGDEWNGYNYYTYLKLAPGTNLVDLEPQVAAASKEYLSEESKLVFHLQPVEEIHLHSDFTFEPEIHGSAKAVRFLEIISLFILIIAWVNYINLSTARSIDRAKEVGLRKVVGARKRQLVGQFLTEAFMINLLGAGVALLLVQAALPYFNMVVGKEIMTQVWTEPLFLVKLGLFFLIGIVAAGLYPALVLSSFKPLQVIQGKFKSSITGHLLRKALVTIQFAASLILIANTIIVYKQVNFMLSKDVGIDIDRVIGFQNPEFTQSNREQVAVEYQAFQEELQKLSGVESVGAIASLPGGGSAEIGSISGGIRIAGMTDVIQTTIYVTQIDDGAQSTLAIPLLEGRNFDRLRGTDTSAVIVNESLIKVLNIAETSVVLNQSVQFGRDPDSRKYNIIGVFGDYNRSSLKNRVEPTVFFYGSTPRNTVARLAGQYRPAQIINNIESTWRKFFPNTPFSYAFVDERFAKLYAEDRRFGQLFANFSILAIIVASMGLFGLSSFLASKRTKEIGIRKVLGASVLHIVLSFFKEYVWLILLAALVGIPLVYLSMSEWLMGYAYHIDFPWWAILVALATVAIFAFMTVGYQNYKVAQINPSEAIRHE